MNLTKEQIENMPAGRELDALIHGVLHPRHNVEGEVYCEGEHHRSEDCDWLPLPCYSTDIAAAWVVLAHFIAQAEESLLYGVGERFIFEAPRFKYSNGYLTHEGYPLGTTCWVVYLIHAGRRYNVCADTAALAICRAALLTTL